MLHNSMQTGKRAYGALKSSREEDEKLHRLRSVFSFIKSNVNLKISSDDMEAYIVLLPHHSPPIPVTPLVVRYFLQNEGIAYGIDEEILRFLSEAINQSVSTTGTYMIASGRSPVPGKDGHWSTAFRVGPLAPEHFPDRGVETDPFPTFNLAGQDSLVARNFPPKKGRPGITVRGMVIPEREAGEIRLRAGAGVRTETFGNETHYLADRPGQVVVTVETIKVLPVDVIEGDVTLSGDSKAFPGSLLVKGNVSGVGQLMVCGHLLVRGTVDRTDLVVGGDLVIERLLLGRKRGRVVARGSVYAADIENIRVHARGELIADAAVFNSELRSEGDITVRGEESAVIGSHLTSGGNISCSNVGSRGNVKVTLSLEADGCSTHEQRALIREFREVRERYQDVRERIRFLMERHFYHWELSREDKGRLKLLYYEKKKLEKNLRERMRRLQRNREIEEHLRSRQIRVRGTANPGVTYRIGPFEECVRIPRRNVTVGVSPGTTGLTITQTR